MKQHTYFRHKFIARKQHGGDFSIRRRKSRRNLSRKVPFHVTLRSDFATGRRSLLRYKNLIYRILGKNSKKFRVKIYQEAICGNHIHLLIKGKSRVGIQNFFRVVAGHIAQQILEQVPIPIQERKTITQLRILKWGNAPEIASYERKFWDALIYSRWVAWGRDFKNVVNYVEMNVLESQGLIPYQARDSRYRQKIKNPHRLRRGFYEWGNAP